MQQHYNLTDEVYSKLLEKVTMIDILQSVPIFTHVGETNKYSMADFEFTAPVTKVSLMHYIDHKGDFTENSPKIQSHQLIAKAVFECLKTEDQMEIFEYISFITGENENDN